LLRQWDLRYRVFLLSPANAGGARAAMLRSGTASFPLAERVRSGGAPLGEVFSFVSGLYFRGKMAYAAAFASPPGGIHGALVIAPGRGLVSAETIVTLEDLMHMACVPVDCSEPRYVEPLVRDARMLSAAAGCETVLLGSVATNKYTGPLSEVLGERLLFPTRFRGLGDMSRGSLMLRAARDGCELEYSPVAALQSKAGGTQAGALPA
jgi:hypothetical protein